MGVENFLMQQNITVTELLKKLKQDKKVNDKDETYSNEESELIVDDTHTEIQQTEQDEFEPIYEEIEDLRDIISKLIKRVEKLESEKKAKTYKEHVEFKEVNPLYNSMFNIPENERTYKPVVVKEEIKNEKTSKLFQTKKDKNQIRKRSQSKHRKYK